jgi:hypothetical protein
VIPFAALLKLIVFENVFKLSYECLMTPFSVRISQLIKNHEGISHRTTELVLETAKIGQLTVSA